MYEIRIRGKEEVSLSSTICWQYTLYYKVLTRRVVFFFFYCVFFTVMSEHMTKKNLMSSMLVVIAVSWFKTFFSSLKNEEKKILVAEVFLNWYFVMLEWIRRGIFAIFKKIWMMGLVAEVKVGFGGDLNWIKLEENKNIGMIWKKKFLLISALKNGSIWVNLSI